MFKNYRSYTRLLLITGILLVSGCTPVSWTTAIRYGDVSAVTDQNTIDIEIINGLVFVPAQINGETYRFLWDTGALFSVSEEIQHRLKYRKLTQGTLTDSDNNRIKVDYVQVNEIMIGTITFTDQTAFVGDFKANPLLECLEIDGIIGSNLIRHGNWTIDQEAKQIRFWEELPSSVLNHGVSVPFKSDRQFNMLLQVNIGQARVSNLIADYGSNGPITVTDKVFSVLKEHRIIDRVYIEEGTKKSGLAGEAVDIARESTVSDSVSINGMPIPEVGIRTGSSGLLGNKVLSRFIVTIDWDRQQLHFKKSDTSRPANNTYGFRMGMNRELGVIIQSVVKSSPVYARGIRSGMRVIKADHLDFRGPDDFCDYVSYMNTPPDTLSLTLEDATGQTRDYIIPKMPMSVLSVQQ